MFEATRIIVNSTADEIASIKRRAFPHMDITSTMKSDSASVLVGVEVFANIVSIVSLIAGKSP